MTHKNGDGTVNASTAVYDIISSWTPHPHETIKQWWELTGPHMSTLLAEAGYTTEQQFNHLLFHLYVVLPRVGAFPSQRSQLWRSPLTLDGSPVEYSWKWNSTKSDPDVRYCIEALGEFTGSKVDPFNQEATTQLLQQLAIKLPGFDLDWFYRFQKSLYQIDRASYVCNGGKPTPTMAVAFELLPKEIMVKAYYVKPQRVNQNGSVLDLDFWCESVNGVVPESQSAVRAFHFLRNNKAGSKCHVAGLAIDCVDAERSRIKLYVQTPDTSFDSMMTLGGAIPGLEKELADLYGLIKLVADLPDDYPSHQPLPPPKLPMVAGLEHFVGISELLSGYIYYFDIAPGRSVPDIKWYIPIRSYGENDQQIADGICRWMQNHGRGQYIPNYLRSVGKICSHRSLKDGLGIQTFIACAFQKGSCLSHHT